MKILSVFLLFSAAAFAQDHAPTLAQCRADAALWDADQALDQHSFVELSKRQGEMAQCSIVDHADASAYHHYLSVIGACQNVEYARMLDFLLRNKSAMEQFTSEDAAGKR